MLAARYSSVCAGVCIATHKLAFLLLPHLCSLVVFLTHCKNQQGSQKVSSLQWYIRGVLSLSSLSPLQN